MKRVFLLIVIAMFALTVAACGSSGSGNTGGSSSPATSTGNTGSTGDPADSTQAETQEEITIEHMLDTTTFKKNPAKVAVFDFGILDSLDKLGVEVATVAQSSLPSYLAKYKDAKYANLGSLVEPDFEGINGLKPDLIIISGRQSDSYDELSKISPTIYMGVDNEHYIESFTENMETLGEIFGKEDLVADELDAINQTINDVQSKVENASDQSSLVILITGGKASAFGPGSRFGLIHDVFGLKPVDTDIEVSTHGQSISFEFIVEKDPDYLFVIDRDSVVSTEGEASASQVLENELIQKTKAYQEGNIVYLDPSYWYLSGDGLTSVAEVANEINAGVK